MSVLVASPKSGAADRLRPLAGYAATVAAQVTLLMLQRRLHVVMDILKEHWLQAYGRVLARIAALATGLLAPIKRQRLIFLTHYLSAPMALCEAEVAHPQGAGLNAARTGGKEIGNLVDTGMGLITAPLGQFRLRPMTALNQSMASRRAPSIHR
jgi:hypothetical protein